MTQSPPTPTNITLHQHSRTLELEYAPTERYELSCEYLRVYSPSAEVRGHTPEEGVLQVGKKHVAITRIVPVGNYALQFIFSDGHDSGIYTWKYLYELAITQEAKWHDYLTELKKAGASREPAGPVVIAKQI